MIAATYTAKGVSARLLRLSQLRNRERIEHRRANHLREFGAYIMADHWQRQAAATWKRAKALETVLTS